MEGQGVPRGASAIVERRYLGEAARRLNIERLLTGRGQYIGDLKPPDALHIAFARSPHAHARIQSVDTEMAAALRGVVAVFTGRDLLELYRPFRVECALPGYRATERPAVAVNTARFVGEPVAVVLAEDRYIAEDAAELVSVNYDPLPAVADMEEAMQASAPRVHETIDSNVLFHTEFSGGDVAEAFSSAKLVLRETFRTNRVAGVPLEPRGCVAQYDARRQLTVWSSTQVPHLLRTSLADLMGFPEERIRVIAPDVGGGFGTKAHVYPEELIVAALAVRLGRPVKWVQDRREDLLTSIHARDHLYRVEVAVDGEGVILGVKLELLTNAGAYPSYPFGCTLEPTGGARLLPGPYRFRNYTYAAYGIATNTCPSGAYRGVAQPSAMLTIEGMMDRIGRALGIDPAQVRFRNLVRPDEFPFVNAVGARYDTGSYTEALQRALAASGYEAYRKRQRPDRLEDGKYRGIGISCFTEITGIGPGGWAARGVRRVPGFDSALVRIEPSGRVSAAVSAADQGQGHETTFAQLVADALGVRMDEVTVLEGDTSVGPYGTGTFASRSAIATGGALVQSSAELRGKMVRIASHLLEVRGEDIVIADGRAFARGAPTRSVTVKDIAEVAYSMRPGPFPPGEGFGLEATAYYGPPPATFANASHIAQVAVDPVTGAIEIERYIVVHDCGRVINPAVVDGQIYGGMVQGLGEVFLEAMVYDADGQLLTGSLMDYLLPSAMEAPTLEIEHLETPSTDTVGGFKGVGEGGLIGALPALTNAVNDALAGLGVTVNTLPLSNARVRDLVEHGKRG
ncbi:MAG: xanthine dehydrogenase family protein molybdopterin-binding subunit [Candidatus Binatia bacterium]